MEPTGKHKSSVDLYRSHARELQLRSLEQKAARQNLITAYNEATVVRTNVYGKTNDPKVRVDRNVLDVFLNVDDHTPESVLGEMNMVRGHILAKGAVGREVAAGSSSRKRARVASPSYTIGEHSGAEDD